MTSSLTCVGLLLFSTASVETLHVICSFVNPISCNPNPGMLKAVLWSCMPGIVHDITYRMSILVSLCRRYSGIMHGM
jgi:hypothetical protein